MLLDPTVDVVVRVQRDPVSGKRCGYPSSVKPAGYYDNHPLGPGNGRSDLWRCSACDKTVYSEKTPGECSCGKGMRLVPERRLIRGPASILGEDKMWKWIYAEEKVERCGELSNGMSVWVVTNPFTGVSYTRPSPVAPTPGLVPQRVPMIKFNADRMVARNDRPMFGSKLNNVLGMGAVEMLPGSVEEAQRFIAAFDTHANAVVTVGTGKDEAAIQDGIDSASAGDFVEVFAGGVANVYTENVSPGGKKIMLCGCVVDQALKITAASGVVLNWATNGDDGSYIHNFEVEATGTATYGFYSNVIQVSLRDIKGHGGSSHCFYSASAYGATMYKNCLAYDAGASGFYGNDFGTRHEHCTAADNGAYGFGNNNAGATACFLCIGSDNTTADYLNNSTRSMLNTSADLTASGSGSATGFVNTDFVNQGADDYDLDPAVAGTTKARFYGIPLVHLDHLNQRRREFNGGYVYAGWHDPDPTAPGTNVALSPVSSALIGGTRRS